MRIIQVHPGILPIPPDGWGAVEKIIWELHNNLLDLGHDSQIKYLNEIEYKDGDIVHIHVANLANEAHKLGIPYYFTMHDHHTVLYGKDSYVYKENLEAIRNAKKAFVPAKYLIEYFENIPIYFAHGVNTSFFTPSEMNFNEHKLLCVANNGYIHDNSKDRKGFGTAIEVARALELPITIAGPKNNNNFFNEYFKEHKHYDKLTILSDLTESELKKVYNEHTIFLHLSKLEAGHPNLTILEAMASGLPVIGTLEDGNDLKGIRKTKDNSVPVIVGFWDVDKNYKKYREEAIQQAKELNWKSRCLDLLKEYGHKDNNMRDKLIEHYNNTMQLNIESKIPKLEIKINNIDGPMVEILTNVANKYKVSFINSENNKIEYETVIGNNCWAKCSVKYFVNWRIIIEDLSTHQNYTYTLSDLIQNNKVYIALDSKSLGDTLAWFPFVEEFAKKHNCNVICSTFWNELFKEKYQNIRFIEPGETANDIVAMYTLGIFFDNDKTDFNKNPNETIKLPLQKIASDILGLEYKEIRPRLKDVLPISIGGDKKGIVTMGIHSTAQAKYWNNSEGWQMVVDNLKSRNILPVVLSSEPNEYMGNKLPNDIMHIRPADITTTMRYIKSSDFFIGLSSGLSWLAWAMNKEVILISGFTSPELEFKDKCIRIINENVCNGCWHRHKFDPSDWNWCPDHKNTNRQFECTKEIKGMVVINAISQIYDKQHYVTAKN